MPRLTNMNMKPKLILLFLLAGIIPLAIVGILSGSFISKAFMTRSYEKLEAVREIKKGDIEKFFAEQKNNTDILAQTVARLQGDAFELLKVEQELKKTQIEAFFSKVRSDILTLSKSEDILRIYGHLKAYHDDMNFGAVEPYDVSTYRYREIYDKYSGYLSNYVKTYGYYDMFLICAAHGHIMFTAAGEKDMGTNLGHGPYKDESLARLWRKIVETKRVAIEDFSSYTPSNGSQAAFIAAPVLDDSNELLGLIALQIPTDPINAIVQKRVTTAKTSETYLVGKCREKIGLRSDILTMGDGKYVIGYEHSSPPPYIEKAVSNKSGEEVFTDTTGQLVIVAYDPLNIGELNWACISKINLEEAVSPGKNEHEDFFSEYILKHSYHDLFLIHPGGKVFYSVMHEKDYGTNMIKGKYSDSGLGKLVRRILKTKRLGIADFEPYPPSDNTPAAFIARPLFHGGKIELIVALRLSTEKINAIMHERKGMGNTGETYLVGADRLMRSDSLLDSINYSVEASFANPDRGRIDTETAKEALSGKSGRKVITDYNGKPILSAYTSVSVGDTTWALLAEVDEAEVKKPIYDLIWLISLVGGGMSVLIILCAFFIAKGIANPLVRIADFATSVAEGDLDADIRVTQKDEIGVLTKALNAMKNNISSVLKETDHLIQDVREGKLESRGNADAFSGSWRRLVLGMNHLIDTFAAPIHGSAEYIDRISKGEIPGKMTENYKGDFNEIKNNINMLISNLRGTVHLAEKISKGDYSVEIEVRSDKDRLSTALNRMIRTLNEITAVAESVASGDYTHSFKIRGERDLLGKAIHRMTENLQKMTDQTVKEDWLKTGQNELNERMRGDQDVVTLTRNVLSCLSEYLNAQVGVCYLAEEGSSETDQQLRLVSSYAYHKRNNNYNTFRLGQGLIGQAALERKTILFTQVPEDHVHVTINSGMGESSPQSIFVVPLVHEEDMLGVLAFGTSRSFTGTETELVTRVSENIAVSIHSARSRTRMETLLEETRLQSEELQAQQEELKANNEELEEQAQMLRESEESLKVQREELQATNEELEEKSELLEQQKFEIEKKNDALDTSRQELEQKAEGLELANKYKSEFLANMSHELRTPLNSLLILAKMLSENEEGNLTEEQIESAKVIHSGGQDLLNLINDILDLSKIEAGKMDIYIEKVGFETIIKAIRNQFNPVAKERGLEFKIETADRLPWGLKTDGQRAEQILKNLLSNAFKFTHKGGVTFSITFPNPGVHFPHSDLTPETAVAFSVADTGIGLSEERQRVIFEAFQQADGSTSRKYGGTGLGLTISRELARKLGGEIQMQSKKGKGSIFTLFLPDENQILAKPPVFSEPAPVMPHEPGIHRKERLPISPELPDAEVSDSAAPAFLADDRKIIREGDKAILIIEDDLRFARILMKFIQKKGYRFLAAGNGKTGMEMACEYKPAAVILDIGLPDMSGLRVLDNLKADLETRHIPIHVISARDEVPLSLKKGAVGHLLKPADPESVNEALSKLETLSERTLRELLIVEDDIGNQKTMIRLLRNKDINITAVGSGKEAYQKITTQGFDCVILDLGLPDMTGFELLEKLGAEELDESCELPPVIIYTGKELTREEHTELRRYAETIVVKGANSPERLLDEVSLFLHTVESSLPDTQKKIIRMLHDPSRILKEKKILLADDDLRNTFALSKVLGNYGLEVVLADNGQLALETLETEEGIDLVLMDIMMPIMDGYEAMQKIRAQDRFKKMPIIALTAKAMPEDRTKCIEAGANDYLTKPVDEDKMISMLKVWLFEV